MNLLPWEGVVLHISMYKGTTSTPYRNATSDLSNSTYVTYCQSLRPTQLLVAYCMRYFVLSLDDMYL